MVGEYIVLDTETTGLVSPGVCEIAWLRVDEDLNILDQFESRVNPERPIEPGAQAVHGISDADVADKPTLAEVAALLPKGLKVIGHNVQFDLRVLGDTVDVESQLCTLALSRRYISGVSNHKLSTLQQELSLGEHTSHSALGDVLTVRDLLLHIRHLAPVSLIDHFVRQSSPRMMHRMPFGKYKGTLTMEVPANYRDWLLKQPGVDRDVQYTFRKLKGIR